MELDNLAIAYLVQELRPALEGAYVNKVSEISTGNLKLKLHTKQGSKDLILTPSSVFITSYSVPARHGKTNFAVALGKQLYNKRIAGIEQHDSDRVVAIKFLEHCLVLELIGEGNKILLDKQGTVLACERNEKWADRETRKGIPYSYPKARGASPAGLDAAALLQTFNGSARDAFREFLSFANVSPVAAEELFFRAGISKATPAVSITKMQAAELCSLARLFYSLHEKPALMRYNDSVFPFELRHLQGQALRIQSINSFLDEQFPKAFSRPAPKQAGGRRPGKDRKTAHEFMQKQQELARAKFESQAQENQRKGELIYEHYSEIEELRKAVLSALDKGLSAEQIMQKISGAAAKGSKAAAMLKRVDAKARKIELEI